MRDKTTLKNKDKHQAMSMKFSEKYFKHENAMSLSFRKTITHKSDEVAELAEKACCETFDLTFQEKISSSVQCLAPSAVPK